MKKWIQEVSTPTIMVWGSTVLLISCFGGLMLGQISLPFMDVVTIIINTIIGMPADAATLSNTSIVWELRLPRIILAACVGMGLSLSGIVMQAVFRNPLADPYIMGISSGASLGAVCVIFGGLGSLFGTTAVGIGAFAGAMIVSFIVASASSRIQSHSPVHLLVFGVAAGALCSGIAGIIIYSGANSTGMDITLYWLMGTIAFPKPYPVIFLMLVLLIMVIYLYRHSRILNLMLVGNDEARSLGIDLKKFLKQYIVLNSLLVGCIVWNAGIIGFVGILIPHFVRILVGANHRRLIPIAVIAGGCMAVWADIFGRIVISKVDIPLGISLALLGAPVFIFLLVRHYQFGDGHYGN